MKNLREKGITLIALVVTIIIMLILVSVTVSTVVENGLFTKARKAVKSYSHASVYESIQIEHTNYQLESQNGYEGTFIKYLDDKGIIDADLQIKDVDSSGEMVSYSKNSKTGNTEYEISKTTLTSSEKMRPEQMPREPEYVINVDVLLGQKSSTGNGKDGKDIYVIKIETGTEAENNSQSTGSLLGKINTSEKLSFEKVSSEKLSSGYRVNRAASSCKYSIHYYGNNEDENKLLGVIEDYNTSSQNQPQYRSRNHI